MSYQTVAGHRSMALDSVRNAAYGAALRQAVTRDSVVLDVGAGTGIHGLMAARLGARRVYLVEPEPILSVAEEIAALNGLTDAVQCLRGRLEDVTLPEPVDVIVSVLTGNFLLTEDLLETLFVARRRWLKPGGLLIPSAASMEVVPVSAAALHDKEIACWSRPQQGLDFSAARRYAANTVFYRDQELRDAEWLGPPVILRVMDFHRDDDTAVHVEATVEVTSSGTCHGWMGWVNMKLDGEWLSASPKAARVHWRPAFLPLDPPLTLERGEAVTFGLDRAPKGDWSWRVRTRSIERRHSTLLGAPLDGDVLKRAALDYRPVLNAEGQALRDVLSRCDGTYSVSELVNDLATAQPPSSGDREALLRLVQRVVKQYA